MSTAYLQVWLIPPVPVVSPAVSAVEFSSQLAADGFEVHEVAEARPGAFPGLVLAAARLTEVSHRGQLSVDRATSKPAVV